jgi:hypothetical protein
METIVIVVVMCLAPIGIALIAAKLNLLPKDF